MGTEGFESYNPVLYVKHQRALLLLFFFSEMSNADFNQQVLGTIPNFKGSSICLNDGLHIKGTYTLKDVSFGGTDVNVTIDLNKNLEEFAYSCKKGLYLNDTSTVKYYLNTAAEETMKDKLKKMASPLNFTAASTTIVAATPSPASQTPTAFISQVALENARVSVDVPGPATPTKQKKSSVALDSLISGQ